MINNLDPGTLASPQHDRVTGIYQHLSLGIAPFARIPEPPHIAPDANWRLIETRFPPGLTHAVSWTSRR